MIERFSISATVQKIHDRFGVDVPKHYKPFYNAGPTHLLPVITHQNPEGLSFFYWGLVPEWAKNKTISEKLINIRAEALNDKPALKKKIMNYRCLIPVDGFYAWRRVGKKTAIPYRFLLKDKSLCSIAGVWEEFEDENEETHHTFSILTVKSNSFVQAVQDRMPVLFEKKEESIWLKKEATETELLNLLRPYPADKLDCYTVSPRIGVLSANESSLLLPTAPADQHGNLTLFD